MSQYENETPEMLMKARQVEFQVSPYMETRILAELRQRQKKDNKFIWYRRWALFSVPAMALALVVFLNLKPSNDVFTAPMGQAIAIRVEIEKIDPTQVAFAEIELPEGVSFYSKAYPAIRTQKKYILAWKNPGLKNNKLPFAVEASTTGVKIIKVRFLDKDSNVSQEQILKVKFI